MGLLVSSRDIFAVIAAKMATRAGEDDPDDEGQGPAEDTAGPSAPPDSGSRPTLPPGLRIPGLPLPLPGLPLPGRGL